MPGPAFTLRSDESDKRKSKDPFPVILEEIRATYGCPKPKTPKKVVR